MTTWTLSDLGCKGDCQQGKLPCTCCNSYTVDAAGAFFSYSTPKIPCVIVDSGASYEPIPFAGMVKLENL